MVRRIALIAAGAVLGGAVAVVVVEALREDDAPAATASTTTSPSTVSSTTTTAPRGPAPKVVLPPDAPQGEAAWQAIAGALDVTVPSDCGLPTGEPQHYPNSERAYRGGVHAGVDFICREGGHDALAALPARVVIANRSFEDPPPEARQAVLDVATALGRTPPWTLAMLYGRFVVLDHGPIDGAGHVVTVYAHLAEIDPAIVPGAPVAAGSRIGEIGNLGTEPAATGIDDPNSIHLHWELLVDDVFLGAGLDSTQTAALYEGLLGGS